MDHLLLIVILQDTLTIKDLKYLFYKNNNYLE